MRKHTRLLAAVEKLEEELADLMKVDGEAIVHAELAAINADIVSTWPGGVACLMYEGDPPELIERYRAKLRELEERGFGHVDLVGIRTVDRRLGGDVYIVTGTVSELAEAGDASVAGLLPNSERASRATRDATFWAPQDSPPERRPLPNAGNTNPWSEK